MVIGKKNSLVIAPIATRITQVVYYPRHCILPVDSQRINHLLPYISVCIHGMWGDDYFYFYQNDKIVIDYEAGSNKDVIA